MTSERGMGLIEALIAGAIVVAMAFVALTACKAVAGAGARSSALNGVAQAVDAQLALLTTNAASALAMDAPTTDEIDFAARTDDGTDIAWRYVYDAQSQTLSRSDCDVGGACGVRDVVTGRIDTTGAYPPLRGVTRFAASTLRADALGDPAQNVYGGIAALFAHSPTSYSVDYRGGAAPGIAGNRIVQAVLTTAAGTRRIHLLAGAMPSGFTVTGLPVWHAIVYRVDQTHRSGFGFIGKSHVFINVLVELSYDGWQTRKQWCNFNLLGNPDGLDGGDVHANYTPAEAFERPENLLDQCRKLHPQPPARDAPEFPSDPNLPAASLPPPPPPACWTNPGPGGRCWPADAPPNWMPPAPQPSDPPPAAWCLGHPRSPACLAVTAPRITS